MKGLIIDEPWISKILRGEKHWEMRSQATAARGTVALIRKGSGTVVGVARIMGCVGPLNLDQLHANAEKHRVPMVEFESGRAAKWSMAWVLAAAQPLPSPVPYKHPFGAVIWVNLDPGVEAAVLAQIEDQPVEIVAVVNRSRAQSAMPEPVHLPASEKFLLDPSTRVPVAKDGTWFGPHLLKAGQFTIGEKGDEQRLDSYEEALQSLVAMDVPRWRRPNPQGNWGIVSGTDWICAGDL